MSEEPAIEHRLNLETGTLNWAELVRHFARGVVVLVGPDLDLVEVAGCMARDDGKQMEQWIADQRVIRAHDDHARDWSVREPDFWCVVVAPWVVVQEKAAGVLH